MGWSTTSTTRDEVTARQKSYRTVSDRIVVAVEHHRYENEDWFLYEVRDVDGKVVERRIGLTVWEGSSFKQLSEAMDPYFFGCPTWWFDQVPQPAQVNPDFNWRQTVRSVGVAQA